jgi:hypothetical protein
MKSLAYAAFAAAEKPLNPDDVRPGYLALLIVLLMCVATFFLLRSFVKHTRKANQPWEGDSGGTKKP